MREVFLVRHGQAEPAPRGPGGDAARALTDAGRASVAAVGRALRAFGAVPAAIWHSPFLRAEETARILAGELGVGALHVEPALTPVASGERAAAAIRDADPASLLCVSHMPLLPELVRELCGARVDFGTATVAHLLASPGGAALAGLWTADKLALVR